MKSWNFQKQTIANPKASTLVTGETISQLKRSLLNRHSLTERSRLAWVSWLESLEFSHFGTHTTKGTMTLRNARKLASGFYSDMVSGKATGFKPESFSMFWAAEPFDTREGYHFHSLIKSSILGMEDTYLGKDENGKHLWKKGVLGHHWTNYKNLGHSRFEKIRGNQKVSNYMSKYMLKNLADFDILITENHQNKTI